MEKTLRHIKRVMITIIGVTVILIALALFVLPGPGFLVLIIGLAILATEYEFARVWLKKAKQKFDDGKNFVTGKKSEQKKQKSGSNSK